jgi:tetratricopeptide (TPR) repeat protein
MRLLIRFEKEHTETVPPHRLSAFIVLASVFFIPFYAIAKSKQSAPSFVLAGDQFRQSGRYRDAIDQYSKAIRLDKRNPKYYQYRADCELALAEYKRSAGDATKSIKLNPGDPDAFSMRARAYDQMKEYKKEKNDLDRLVSLQPTGPNLLLRAQTKTHLKEYASVVDDCNAAISMGLSRPDLSQLYHLRSDAYKKLGKKREYEQELAKYNSLQP